MNDLFVPIISLFLSSFNVLSINIRFFCDPSIFTRFQAVVLAQIYRDQLEMYGRTVPTNDLDQHHRLCHGSAFYVALQC